MSLVINIVKINNGKTKKMKNNNQKLIKPYGIENNIMKI